VVDLSTTYVAGGLSLASGLVLLPVAAQTIGLHVYGTWLALSAVQQLFFALDLGIPVTIVRFSAAATSGTGTGMSLNDIWVMGRRVLAVVGSCQFLAFLAVAALARESGNLDFSLLPLVVLGAGVFLVGVPVRLPLHVLQGTGHYSTTSFHLIAGTLIGQSLKVAAMVSGAPDVIVWLAVGDVLTVSLPGLLSYARLRRSRPFRFFTWPRAAGRQAPRSRDLVRFAGSNAMLATSGAIVTYVSTILVAVLLSPVAVSVFDAAMRIYQGGRRAQDMLMGPLLPWATRQVSPLADGVTTLTGLLYRRVSRLVILPMTVVLVVTVHVTPQLLDLWLGPQFTDAVVPLRLLLCVLVLQTLLIPGLLMRQARNLVGRYAWLTTAWMLLSVPATALLIWTQGLPGAALGALIPLVLLFLPLLLVGHGELLGRDKALPVQEVLITAAVAGLIATASVLSSVDGRLPSIGAAVAALAGVVLLATVVRAELATVRREKAPSG